MGGIEVISPVMEPTLWCAGMVVLPTNNRETMHLHSVLRKLHPLLTIDATLAKLSGARVFSKLDLNTMADLDTSKGGFFLRRNWSSYRCHPHTRGYQSNPWPMCKSGFATSEGINPNKCQFHWNRINFLGHVIDSNGVALTRQKQKPLRRCLHWQILQNFENLLVWSTPWISFTQYNRFVSATPGSQNAWMWTNAHSEALQNLRRLSQTESHTEFWLLWQNKETKVSVDASTYVLGSVLLQWHKKTVASGSVCIMYSFSNGITLHTDWEGGPGSHIMWKFSNYILGK